MAYATDCSDHDRCTVIVSDGWPDQSGSWASHFENDVSPSERLDPDVPREFEDRREGHSGTIIPVAPSQRSRDRLHGLLTRDDVWVGPVDPDGNPVRDGTSIHQSR